MGNEHGYVLNSNVCLLATTLVALVGNTWLNDMQEPINRRYTPTIYLIYHCLLPAIPFLSILPSSYCPQTTPNLYICKQTVPWNSTPPSDATIPPGFHVMGEI